jgi:hypothetical protein
MSYGEQEVIEVLVVEPDATETTASDTVGGVDSSEVETVELMSSTASRWVGTTMTTKKKRTMTWVEKTRTTPRPPAARTKSRV